MNEGIQINSKMSDSTGDETKKKSEMSREQCKTSKQVEENKQWNKCIISSQVLVIIVVIKSRTCFFRTNCGNSKKPGEQQN